MKATRLIIGFLVVAIAATGAFANCIPQKTFANFNAVETPGLYTYIETGDPAATINDLVGRFWQTGNRSASNEGTYDQSLWLLPSLYYAGQFYLNGNLSDPGVPGCPAGAMTLTVEDTVRGQFVSMAVNEDPPRSFTFDYSKLNVNQVMAPIPRPRVTQSSRDGANNVIVDVAVDDASAGVYDVDTGGGADVTAVGIYVNAAGAGSDVADGWTLLASVPNGGSAVGLTVDCGGGTGPDQELGAALELNGVGGTTIGPRTFIECDPNLADPGNGKFKLIDRPNKPGNKPIKRR